MRDAKESEVRRLEIMNAAMLNDERSRLNS